MNPKSDPMSEPVAIVGMAARLPQDASNVEAFWKMLCEGRSARNEIPKDRFNIDGFYYADVQRLDSLSTRYGYFLKDAAMMDPQQRGLLEVAYQALENAGITAKKASGSNMSGFVGASVSAEHISSFIRDPAVQSKHAAIGGGTAFLANRFSHFFNLRGPTMTVDTACSGSLHALHLACQSIRARESDSSIVAGSNLILSPDSIFVPLSNGGFLASDGICKSFDKNADGYARGEGFVVLVLKRLSTALEDGDVIRAVIRATGVNSDGKTPNVTQPSGSAQKELIKSTYDSANIDLASTILFEAHGTGTPVGDPIEANAVGQTFQKSRPSGLPLFIGSVKSVIGHLEAVSGLAAIVKTIFTLETGVIPGFLFPKETNLKIDVERLRLKPSLPPYCYRRLCLLIAWSFLTKQLLG